MMKIGHYYISVEFTLSDWREWEIRTWAYEVGRVYYLGPIFVDIQDDRLDYDNYN